MSPSNPPAEPKAGHRIAKLLARAGVASRREIERMIEEGRIALNGQVIDTPATILTSVDGITVDGIPVGEAEPTRLFRYHKPAGTLTAERDFTGRPTIYEHMPDGLPRVMPVGRLDLNTEGLLLLTTDGELKRQLELPASGVERTYRARAYGHVTQEQLEELMLGTEIEGVRYGPINANIERRTGANLWIEMTLTEGKNREVRRVLEHLGLQVSRLIRTRYGPFYLADLPTGDVDEIRQSDLHTFRTVLSKPNGGKAASNLTFAVRQRVVEAPRKEKDEAPQNATGRSPRREPERPSTRPLPPKRAPHAAKAWNEEQQYVERPFWDDEVAARPQRAAPQRDSRASRADAGNAAPRSASYRNDSDRPARPTFGGRPERGDRFQRAAHGDAPRSSSGFRENDNRAARPAFGARADRGDRFERPARGESPRGARPERSGAYDRAGRAEGSRGPRSERGERPQREGFAGRRGEGRFEGRSDTRFGNRNDSRGEGRSEFRGEGRGEGRGNVRGGEREARFTPRVTPGRGKEEQRRGDERPLGNANRAARSEAHRGTLAPRPPRKESFGDRPTKGPAGGRGRPARPAKPTGPRKRK